MRALLSVVVTAVLVAGCSSDGTGGDEPPVTGGPATTSESPPGHSSGSSSEPAADGLHLDCAGEGGPTVVLIAGLNTSGETFSDLRDRLAEGTRACFYDRAGIGDSPPLPDDSPAPAPGSAATQLRETLAAAGVDPPYVVLGWSYGGLVAQAYAKSYPDDVSGLVLEDTSVREQFTDPVLINPEIDWREGGRAIDKRALRVDVADPDYGDLPVAVLSQDFRARWIPAFYAAHDRLARASTDGVHAIGIGSGHAMHEDVPGLVARAVQAVWSSAAAGTPLPPCRVVFGTAGGRCRV